METDAETGSGQCWSDDVGGALSALRSGRKVARRVWSGSAWLEMADVERRGLVIYRVVKGGTPDPTAPPTTVTPWVPEQADLLTSDWFVLPK